VSRSPAPAGETLGFEARLARGAFRLDVAFEVRPGERLALVGPSGAGKSTCLQVIAGFVRPDAGHVTLGGRALLDTARGVDLPPAARDIGLLFQDYALFPHLSVRDNVAFGPRARGRSAGDATRVAGEWLERLEIAELGAARIDRISGGQRQRVALARAMAAGARVLLLDEPFAALDLVTRTGVRAGLRAFLEQVPLPTVFVTHDPLDARVFGDRIGVLEEGRLVQLGTWQDIAHAPRSALAAELAGLNLHRVRLEAGEGLRAARVDTVEFHVLAPGLEGDVHLAFAPGEVTLSAERPAGSAQNVFTARVVELIPVEDRLRVRLDAGVPITAEITIEARAALGIEAGREIFAAVKATAIRVYR
jgi:molybdate transport system ATP-binding protein